MTCDRLQACERVLTPRWGAPRLRPTQSALGVRAFESCYPDAELTRALARKPNDFTSVPTIADE